MNCGNCGKPLFAGSTICPVCGVDNANLVNNQSVSNNSMVPPQGQILNNGESLVNESVVSDANTTVDKLEELETLDSGDMNANNSYQEAPQNLEQVTENEPTSLVGESQSLGATEYLESNEEIAQDELEPKVDITENMAPPTLNVEEENLTQGAGELSNENSVSTYSEEALTEQKHEEQAEQIRQEERVDIAIPTVGEVSQVALPSDGTAPEVKENTDTVGETTTTDQEVLEEPNKKKKFKIALSTGSKSVPKTIMIIVAIIFLVIGVLLGKMFFSKNYCATTNSSNRNILNNKKIKYVSDGKNNITNILGVTYKIPEQYTYDKRENGVLIYGEGDTFRLYIKTEQGLYSDLTGAKNSIKASMIENSINVSNVKELKANDVEFLVFETTTKLVNRMIAFASAPQDQVFYLEIVNTNNNYDYDVLDVAADILKNATYEEVSTNMEKIDIEDISEVSIKAALEYKNLVKR